MTSLSHQLKNNHQRVTWVIGASLGIILALCGLYVWRANHTDRPVDTAPALVARPIDSHDHIQGDPSAPIEIIMYSSFECRACGTFHTFVEPYLTKKYRNQIVFVYRHVTIPELPESAYYGEVSECIASNQGEVGFWQFAQTLYALPEYGTRLATSTLLRSALSTGISEEALTTCLTEHKSLDRVEKDINEASIAGVYRIPAILVRSQSRALIIQGGGRVATEEAIRYVRQSFPKSQ